MENSMPEYAILHETALWRMEEATNKMYQQGWQPAGSLQYAPGVGFFHELIRFKAPSSEPAATDQTDVNFTQNLANMDGYVKDLLLINKIELECQGGHYFTRRDGKIFEGIGATQVLALLKDSRHCPIDLDEARVIKAIEGLV